MLGKLIVWIFLSISAWEDWHKKSVPVWVYLVFCILGFGMRCALVGQWFLLDLLGSVGVGVTLLWICVLTKGGIGEGDGWFFVVSGFYLSWSDNWLLLTYGLLLSSVYGMVCMIQCRFCYNLIRRKTIAFLPFLLIPGWWVICL